MIYVTFQRGGKQYRLARITFPPGVIKPGWTVSIEQSTSDQTFPSFKSCNEEKKKLPKQLAAPRFDINVIDETGRVVDISNLKDLLTLEAFSTDIDNRDACMGFAEGNRNNNQWECLGNSDQRQLKSGEGSYIKSQSDHLTTFAVLLLGSTVNDACSVDWIWPTSVALLGVAFCCMIFAAYCGTRKRFKPWVYGFQEGARVTRIIEKAGNH